MRRGVVVTSLVLAVLVALPMQAALGAKPFRDPFRDPVGAGSPRDGEGSFSFILTARESACSFDQLVNVEVIGIDWIFSDGRFVWVNVATITLTNLETGTSYVQSSRYHSTTTIAADGTEHVVINGQRWMGFPEGDQGPEGEVGPVGADYFVTGKQTFVYDPKKDLITSYELDGQAVDACEVLA